MPKMSVICESLNFLENSNRIFPFSIVSVLSVLKVRPYFLGLIHIDLLRENFRNRPPMKKWLNFPLFYDCGSTADVTDNKSDPLDFL